MKNIDEQFTEIIRRSHIVKEKKDCTRRIAYNATGAALCLILVISAVILAPKIQADVTESMMSDYGSLIITSPYTGYVIIGILAFMLGVFLTLLCKRILELKSLDKPEGESR
ncbi:MAG: hypothetical protein J6Y89_11200 [Lachnospiraceae bacterium]|nr:hypothetical protein [Lachnospiraceae bacterium]